MAEPMRPRGLLDLLFGRRPPAPPVAHAPHGHEHLMLEESAGLTRLTDAVVAALAEEGYLRGDIEWIAEEALFQLGRLIQSGQPIHVPSLGRFCRHQPPGDRKMPEIEWIVDGQLLEPYP